MNRNEQVNGEKMWEYIGKIGRKIKKYKTEIAVSLLLPLTFGCTDLEDKEFWDDWKNDMAQMRQDIRDSNRESRTVHVYHYGIPDYSQESGLNGPAIRAHTIQKLEEMKRGNE